MGGIFISYRRSDAEGWAGRLSDSLKAELGRVNIFRDIDDIPPGVEFDTYIADAVGSCEVLIALIGPHWLTVTEKSGRRRLDDPRDFIRLEIATALNRNVRVIPALVGNAQIPAKEELPEDVQALARRQAYELSDNRWADDCRKLASVLKPLTKRTGRFNASVAAVGFAIALLIAGGYGVKLWRDHQSEIARQEAEAKAKTDQERIAQETAAREEAEKKRLAQKEVERKTASAWKAAVVQAENASGAASQSAASAAKYASDATIYFGRVSTAPAAAEGYRMPTRVSNETIQAVQAAVADAAAARGRARTAARSAQEAATNARTSARNAAHAIDEAGATRAALDALAAATEANRASKTTYQEFQTTKVSADAAARGLVALRDAKDAYDSARQKPSDTRVDSFALVAVAPPITTLLRSGEPSPPLTATIQYTLASVDRAIIGIFIEQYPGTAGGCIGTTHRANGNAYLLIGRGSNSNLKIRVKWPGGGGSGYLSLGANLWEDAGGSPGKIIRSFGIFTRYCYRVEP